MFAVIYQSFVKPDCEQEYRKAWHQVAAYFIAHRGAYGSSLHRASNGMWVAYSRWPSKEVRDASWPSDGVSSTELPEEIRVAILTLKNCLDPEKKLPEICMEVIEVL